MISLVVKVALAQIRNDGCTYVGPISWLLLPLLPLLFSDMYASRRPLPVRTPISSANESSAKVDFDVVIPTPRMIQFREISIIIAASSS